MPAPDPKTLPIPEKHARPGAPALITGGAGFVGCNLAHRLCLAGRPVIIYDNLSRAGVERNLAWLRETHGSLVHPQVEDVCDAQPLTRAVREASAVYHFAAQVAVTSSLTSPALDFEVNARGTLNVLEAVRALRNPPPLFFTSTNKVYGSLENLEFQLEGKRYQPVCDTIRGHGISETQRLDFYSPYGCSKGAADQYVLDYARIFGLRAVVFRMSCIYGPHQCGTEDQGWVAHFLIQAMRDRTITLYGDGNQVRDVLFVDDLLNAFEAALTHLPAVTGQAFNIGGGPRNSTSLRELLDRIGELRGRAPDVEMNPWRPGDQRYYVSDFSKFRAATGWAPRTSLRDGVETLHDWLGAERPAPRGAELSAAAAVA